MTGVLIRRVETQRQRHVGRMWPCDNGGRDWTDASTSKPRNTKDSWQIPETRKNSPRQVSEGAGPCWHLDFIFLASRIVRQYISDVLSHPVCNLLWQPEEKNTVGVNFYHKPWGETHIYYHVKFESFLIRFTDYYRDKKDLLSTVENILFQMGQIFYFH